MCITTTRRTVEGVDALLHRFNSYPAVPLRQDVDPQRQEHPCSFQTQRYTDTCRSPKPIAHQSFMERYCFIDR